jgi:hypothetical protein
MLLVIIGLTTLALSIASVRLANCNGFPRKLTDFAVTRGLSRAPWPGMARLTNSNCLPRMNADDCYRKQKQQSPPLSFRRASLTPTPVGEIRAFPPNPR